MTCAKARVTACVQTAEGRQFWGSNDVRNPQRECPRVGVEAARDRYTMCRIVCRQPHHAEVGALLAAGKWAVGATLYVAHHRCCPDCQSFARECGIAEIIVGRLPDEED